MTDRAVADGVRGENGVRLYRSRGLAGRVSENIYFPSYHGLTERVFAMTVDWVVVCA